MYVYVYVYVYVCVYVYVYMYIIYVYVNVNVYVYVCVYVYVYVCSALDSMNQYKFMQCTILQQCYVVCVYIHRYLYKLSHTHIYIYIYMCVCVYVYIYIYIYIYYHSKAFERVDPYSTRSSTPPPSPVRYRRSAEMASPSARLANLCFSDHAVPNWLPGAFLVGKVS